MVANGTPFYLQPKHPTRTSTRPPQPIHANCKHLLQKCRFFVLTYGGGGGKSWCEPAMFVVITTPATVLVHNVLLLIISRFDRTGNTLLL
jgi:hypothetical protein